MNPYGKYAGFRWAESIAAACEREARAILDGEQACHDWDHTLRVRHNAAIIVRGEPDAEPLVVDVAAILHDIARPQELADHRAVDHAVLGADMAAGLLTRLGVTCEPFVRHVSACIRTHRYRRRDPAFAPATIEAEILYDADKLDSVGAVGIARSFHFAGHIGARVHNTAAEALASDSYSREDSAYREYLVKLRHLKDNMLTRDGRRMAAERSTFMDAFFDELNRETETHP